LLFAADAYFASRARPHQHPRELFPPINPDRRVRDLGRGANRTRTTRQRATLTDSVIVLFVVDLAILLSPWH
jgi:hypothetical protein